MNTLFTTLLSEPETGMPITRVLGKFISVLVFHTNLVSNMGQTDRQTDIWTDGWTSKTHPECSLLGQPHNTRKMIQICDKHQTKQETSTKEDDGGVLPTLSWPNVLSERSLWELIQNDTNDDKQRMLAVVAAD